MSDRVKSDYRVSVLAIWQSIQCDSIVTFGARTQTPERHNVIKQIPIGE